MKDGPFRLVALDLDGTLLDPAGSLRPAVRDAVRRASQRGARIVICTGRRYRTTRPVLEALGVVEAVVLQNGVLVKDAAGRTLHQRYLPASLYHEALAALREVAPPLVYVDPPQEGIDIVSEPLETLHPFQREYLADNLRVTRFVASLEERPSDAVVMLSCMAEEAPLRALRQRVDAALSGRARSNLLANLNYRGHILEIVSTGASKWAGLRRLAAAAGIAPSEILALGDDENDAEMLRGAGRGVAMANAVPAARNAADEVAASNADDGVAEALERLLPGP